MLMLELRPGRFRWSLALKLAAGLAPGAVLIFAGFGYAQERMQRRQLEDMVRRNAEQLTDIIRSSAWDHMMANDREGLYGLIRNVGREPGIRLLRLMSEDGEIRHSSATGEVGHIVDRTAEACLGCHSGPSPASKLAPNERTRIFRAPDGGRVLAAILPVENHKDCSSAACHAHPESRRVLGVIDVHLELDDVDARLAEGREQIGISLLISLLVLLAISFVFIWRVVYRPVHLLREGTRRLAAGDLDVQIDVDTDDELGDLARSFNSMTVALSRANRDLSDWARTLESRVEGKTAELERAHRGLLRSEKMASLGRLAATVAHEVNNPLFGMLTYARLCRKELDKSGLDDGRVGRIRENLRIIERESVRCGDLMKSLLAFARNNPLRRGPYRLEEVVERALQLVRNPYQLAGIDLQVDVAPGLPDMIGDAGQIQQVLVALLMNASEALGHGGAVSVAAAPAPDGAVISIRDTGPGVPLELQAAIFEPFFSTKENQHRTGLGLAIAKDIVERHGGSLRLESTPGHGALFVITLPREAPEELAAPATPAGAAARKEEACPKAES
jgi:two-component system NtrC family sensor kinase